MYDFQQQSDPGRNRQFRRTWVDPQPATPAQQRLSELRRELGNAVGTQVFREEQRTKKAAWL